MKRDIVIERVLPHPVDQVWRALTDAAVLGQWFMENDFEPTLGRPFTFRMKPQRGWDGVTHCEVFDLQPRRTVAFSYRGEATGEKVIACAGVKSDAVKSAGKGVFARLNTTLRFTLDAQPGAGHTRLRLEHRGFEGLTLVVVSFVMGFGWKRRVLERLAALLAHQSAANVS